MSEKIAVFGLGNVGLVCALCLAQENDIIGVELIEEKVALLNRGELYIFEDKLDQLLSTHKERISFDCSPKVAIDRSIIVVCVGTPSSSSGTVNLDQVMQTANQLGELIKVSRGSHQTLT